MKINLFLLCAFALLFCSCFDNKKSTIDFKAANGSLTLSSKKIKNQNDSIYKILDGKLLDEKTAKMAILWVPKAIYLKYQSDKIYTYLDTLIYNLNRPAQFINADSLYSNLNSYKGSILRIDPDIYIAINKSVEVMTHDLDSIRQNKNEKFDLYFSNKSKDEQLFILKQAINNIESIENEILLFCNNEIK